MHEHKSEQNPSYFNLSNRKILTPLDHVSSSSSCFQKNYSVCGGGGRGGSGKGGGGKPLGMKKKNEAIFTPANFGWLCSAPIGLIVNLFLMAPTPGPRASGFNNASPAPPSRFS